MSKSTVQKITVMLDVQTKLDSLKSGLNQFKQAVDKIELDPMKKGQFKASFAQYEQGLESIQKKLADSKGRVGMGDLKELRADAKELDKIYDSLMKDILKIEKSSPAALKEMFPPELLKTMQQLTAATKEYDKALDKLNKDSLRIQNLETDKKTAQKSMRDSERIINDNEQAIQSKREGRAGVEEKQKAAQKRADDIQKGINTRQKNIEAFEKAHGIDTQKIASAKEEAAKQDEIIKALEEELAAAEQIAEAKKAEAAAVTKGKGKGKSSKDKTDSGAAEVDSSTPKMKPGKTGAILSLKDALPGLTEKEYEKYAKVSAEEVEEAFNKAKDNLAAVLSNSASTKEDIKKAQEENDRISNSRALYNKAHELGLQLDLTQGDRRSKTAFVRAKTDAEIKKDTDADLAVYDSYYQELLGNKDISDEDKEKYKKDLDKQKRSAAAERRKKRDKAVARINGEDVSDEEDEEEVVETKPTTTRSKEEIKKDLEKAKKAKEKADKDSQVNLSKEDQAKYDKKQQELQAKQTEQASYANEADNLKQQLEATDASIQTLEQQNKELSEGIEKSKTAIEEYQQSIDKISTENAKQAFEQLKAKLAGIQLENVDWSKIADTEELKQVVSENFEEFKRQAQLMPQAFEGIDIDWAEITDAQEFTAILDQMSQEEIKEFLNKISGTMSTANIDWKKITNIDELNALMERLNDEGCQQVKQGALEAKQGLETMKEESDRLKDSFDKTEKSINKGAEGLDKLGNIARKAVDFFGLTNATRLFRQGVQKAFNTVRELDKAMTETAVVTDYSVGDMWSQLPKYTEVANKYSSTLKDAYDVMTLYYQQGLEQNQVFAVGEQTMKMARIAGLDYAEATDRMTNALRGFNMEITTMNSEHVADVYSQLAAMSASNVEELSKAMTKTASLANSANMSFDNTAAFLAQIIETTRESAETAGTALKTVIARFSEVKNLYTEGDLIGDVEGEAVDVNKVGAALRAAGVDLNEFMTGAKGLDEIFIELASKWDSLDLLTQRYIATMAAGSRQQSRFLALMGDNERLTELLQGAYNAAGASTQQFSKTEESLESKLNKAKTAWQTFIMSIFNSDLVKWFVDAATKIGQALNKFFDSFSSGGGKTAAILGTLLTSFIGLRKGLQTLISVATPGLAGLLGLDRAGLFKQVKSAFKKVGGDGGVEVPIVPKVQGFKEKIESIFKKNPVDVPFVAAQTANGKINGTHLSGGTRVGLGNTLSASTAGNIFRDLDQSIEETSKQFKVLDRETKENALGLRDTTILKGKENEAIGTVTREYNESGRVFKRNTELFDDQRKLVSTLTETYDEHGDLIQTVNTSYGDETKTITTLNKTKEGEILISKETLNSKGDVIAADHLEAKASENAALADKVEAEMSEQAAAADSMEGGSSLAKGTGGSAKTAGNFLTTTLGQLGVELALVAAGIAIVVGVIAAFKGIYSEAMANQKALETLSDGAKGLSEAADNVKKSFQDVSSAAQDYEEAQERIANATEKNAEYWDAVQQNNQAAIDLVEIAKQYGIENGGFENVNGILTLDPKDKKYIEDEMAKKSAAAAASAIQAQTSSDLAEDYNKIESDTIKSIKTDQKQREAINNKTGAGKAGRGALVGASAVGGTVGGAVGGTLAGVGLAALATTLGVTGVGLPLALAIGALAAGTIAGGVGAGVAAGKGAKEKNKEADSKVLDDIYNKYITKGKDALDDDETTLLDSALENHDKKKAARSQAVAKNTAAIQQQFGEDVSEEVASIVAESITDKENVNAKDTKLAQKMEELASKDSSIKYKNGKVSHNYETNDQALIDWATAQGYTVVGNDVLDEEGNKVNYKKKTTEILAWNAQQKLDEETADKVQNWNSFLDSKNAKTKSNFEKFFSGKFQGLDLAEIQKSLEDLSTEEQQALAELLGVSVKKLDDELLDRLNEARAEQVKIFKETGNLIFETTSDLFTDEQREQIIKDFKDLSDEQKATFAEQFKEISSFENEDITKFYLENFKDLKDQLDDLDTSSLAAFRNSLIDLKGEAYEDTAKNIPMVDIFKEFLTSDTISELDEQLKDLIDTNGTLTADNIIELAKQSKNLATQLGYTEEQWEKLNQGEKEFGTLGQKGMKKVAQGLANVLTLVKKGIIDFDTLTKEVVAFSSEVTTLQQLQLEVKNYIENFDAGDSELEGLEFYDSQLKTLQEKASKGEYDSQFVKILSSVFEDATIHDTDTAKQYYEKFFNMWNDHSFGTDTGINKLIVDDLEKGKTTNDILKDMDDKLKNNPNYKDTPLSENFLKSWLLGFAGGSPEARWQLATNNFDKGIEAALNASEGGKLTESEIKAITGISDLSSAEIKTLFENYAKDKGKTPKDYIIDSSKYRNDKGQVDLSKYGIKDLAETYGFSIEDWNKLGEDGWTESEIREFFKKYKVDQDIADQYISEIGTDKSKKGRYSTEMMTIDEETRKQNAEAFANAFVNALKEAFDGPIKTFIFGGTKDGTEEGTEEGAKNADVSSVGDNIQQDLSSRTFTINVEANVNMPTGSSATIPSRETGFGKWKKTQYQGRNGTWYDDYNLALSTYASGGSIGSHETALVGEEGPELIQYKHGGAYLAGTNGPEMTSLDRGDIVYSNPDTEKIFKRGGFNYFDRYANGTNKLTNTLWKKFIEEEQKAYSYGGNVDLNNRPIVSGEDMIKAGYLDEDPNDFSTVYTSTYSNEDGTVAVNVTPIKKDGSIYPASDLQAYGEALAEGLYDSESLQIGEKFYGKDAIKRAEEVAEKIHRLQEAYYSDTKKALQWNLKKELLKDWLESKTFGQSLENYLKDKLNGYDYENATYQEIIDHIKDGNSNSDAMYDRETFANAFSDARASNGTGHQFGQAVDNSVGWHRGVDLHNGGGPIPSISSGRVIGVVSGFGPGAIGNRDNNGWGNQVIIEDEAGNKFYYSHLKNTSVTAGSTVTAGQIIGTEGTSGNSSGSHLDFMIETPSGFVDPRAFINGAELTSLSGNHGPSANRKSGGGHSVGRGRGSGGGQGGIEIPETAKKIIDIAKTITGSSGPYDSGDKDTDSTDATKDNTDALDKNTKATQDLANVERNKGRLQKELSELQEGGVWTAPWQYANLRAQRKLLDQEYKVQKDLLDQKEKELDNLKDTNKEWEKYIKFDKDTGEASYTDAYSKAVENGTLSQEQQSSLGEIVSKANEVQDQKDVMDNYFYDLDDIRDQEDELFGQQVDQAVDLVNQGIDSMGQLANSAIAMIEALAEAAIEGFKSYLGWLTIRFDDEHDIGQLDTSLQNSIDRLNWEYEKLLKRNIAYETINSMNERELFENSNESAKDIITRIQNQRQLYQNSFRQLEDLGLNISSELTEAFESLYDKLYGPDGPFTKLNKRKRAFEKQINELNPSITAALGEANSVITGILSNIGEGAANVISKLFPNSIFSTLKEDLQFDGYELGDFGKNKLQRLIEIFTELTPSFNADYQIANKSELVDGLQQKLSTIITQDTITYKFVQGYLEYLSEVESQMEGEVENIRNSEKEILDLYDNLTEILERGKDQYEELEQDLYDAIVDSKNSLLEELQALHDSISNADSDLLDTLKKNLDLIRQQRENNKTEEDLQAKEARLAYLRQDTSGANLQEILKLEKELEEGQESYTDKLIDQKISQLQDQNEEAAKQRQIQIDLLQAEIENTKDIWDKVQELLLGIAKFDKYLTGEVDRDGYANIIAVLKDTKEFKDSSAYQQENSEKEWDTLIRGASLYQQVKDNLEDEYRYLKLATEILDRETGLPKDYAPNEGWHNYVAFSNLETTINRSTDVLKEAIAAINNVVEKITVSYDDEMSLHMKTTYYGGLIQAISGTEYAAKKTIEDIAQQAPGILQQVTTGTGNIAKGMAKMGFGLIDSTEAGIISMLSLIPEVLGTGGMGGGATTTLGDVGEAIGMLVEGVSNLAAAATDAASLGMQIIGDTAPGFADIGVAIATSLKETFSNDYVRVNNELQDNIDAIIDNIGDALGKSGYLKEIKEGLRIAQMADYGAPEDVTNFKTPIYQTIEEEYKNILSDYQHLLSKKDDYVDIEGFNSLYVRILKLKEIVNHLSDEFGDYPELDPSESIESVEHWRGEIGSLFQKIGKGTRDIVVSIVNGILGKDGLTLGEKKIGRWIDLYDEIIMLDPSSSTLQSLADAMQTYSPELSNKLFKLYEREYEREHTPQETLITFWEKKLGNFWSDFQTHLGGFFDGIKNFFTDLFGKIFNTQNDEDNRLANGLEKITAHINLLGRGLGLEMQGNTETQTEIGVGVQGWLERIWKVISGFWTSFLGIFGIDNQQLNAAMTGFFQNVFNGATDLGDRIRAIAEFGRHAAGGTIRHNETALVGEAGAELIQHANGGATLASGPAMAKLQKGDVVYNASQTKQILKGKSLDFRRFAEGTVDSFMFRDPLTIGVASIPGLPPISETGKESIFNLNLSLEDLTVDSPDRVEQVANRVMEKITTTVNGAIWPYNKL